MSKEDIKFKSNPYNYNNRLLTELDVINIMKSLHINDFKPNNISFYQRSFIHKSYCKLRIMKNMNIPEHLV